MCSVCSCGVFWVAAVISFRYASIDEELCLSYGILAFFFVVDEKNVLFATVEVSHKTI